jgi:hypothetical protein
MLAKTPRRKRPLGRRFMFRDERRSSDRAHWVIVMPLRGMDRTILLPGVSPPTIHMAPLTWRKESLSPVGSAHHTWTKAQRGTLINFIFR